jgi:hypothetical protein
MRRKEQRPAGHPGATQQCDQQSHRTAGAGAGSPEPLPELADTDVYGLALEYPAVAVVRADLATRVVVAAVVLAGGDHAEVGDAVSALAHRLYHAIERAYHETLNDLDVTP